MLAEVRKWAEFYVEEKVKKDFDGSEPMCEMSNDGKQD
jgi:hypothetical protein